MEKFVCAIVVVGLFGCVFGGTSEFTPTYPECAVNYNMSVSSSHDTFREVYYGYVTNETIIMQMYEASNSSQVYLARCDMKNEEGKCFLLYSLEGGCKIRYDTPDHIRKETIYEIFDPEEYDDSRYPVDEACPDSTQSGCKKYCNDDDSYCFIVDAKGHLLQKIRDGNDRYYNMTWSTQFDSSVFVDHDCDGKPLSPPVDPCAPPKTSSSSVPPRGASSSVPPASSASFIQVAVSVVVAAIAIALL